jgi:hypothetical protein
MADDRKPLSILSDQPADEDRLNFDPYAKTLADIVADPGTDTPLTIGVFGAWGRGKTSLMRIVGRRLEATADTNFPVCPVWFNAWRYSREETLWRALIARVLEAVRAFPDLDPEALKDLDQLEGRLYSPIAPSSGHLTLPPDALPQLGGASLPTLTGLELLRRQAKRQEDEAAARQLEEIIADVEQSEVLTRRDQLVALDDFRRHFEAISKRCIVPHGRLAVFMTTSTAACPTRRWRFSRRSGCSWT